jgi:methyltransferase (TIGR00027 family)
MNVAICRAIAAHEPREEIRGRDSLAEIFLSEEARKSLTVPAARPLILGKLAAVSPGGYEYFLARTAYLDALVEQSLLDNVPQIVFLGAGYDTRAYRFANLAHDTRIFELDTEATLQHKQALLQQAGVEIPEALTFVAVDFTRDDWAQVLDSAGYESSQRTLFVWEGVTYYLSPRAVDATLEVVQRHSPAGSTIAFDYMLPAADLEHRYGAAQSRAAMQAMYAAEPLQFDLAERDAASFLAQRGFELVEHLTADELQTRYLTLRNGTLAGQVLDLFRLVCARVR